jgi:hypothetical protein
MTGRFIGLEEMLAAIIDQWLEEDQIDRSADETMLVVVRNGRYVQ